MRPIFEFSSHITSENYRKGLKSGINYILYIINGLLGTFFILYAMWTIIRYVGYIASGITKGSMFLVIVVYGVLLILGISILVSAFRTPQKVVDNAVNEIVMRTGSADFTINSCFYDNEITVTGAENPDQILHFPYEMISAIHDFRDFIILSGPNRGIYLEKSVIYDNQTFYDFIWSKCPKAKYKKHNK